MITARLERRVEATKDRLAVMKNFSGLTVDNPGGAYDESAKSLANGLMAQANAKDRNASGKTQNQRKRYSRISRAARARRDQDSIRDNCLNLIQCYLVVASHDDVLTKLAQVLDQVVSKRIVVIDD